MTTRVALDTSALMMPVELDVRLFDELDRLLDGGPRGPAAGGGRGSMTDAGNRGSATDAGNRTASNAGDEPGSDDPRGSTSSDPRGSTSGAVDGPELGVGSGSASDTGADRKAEAIQPTAPQPVVEELRRLAEKGGTEGTAATVGHDLATERCLVVDTEAPYADDALVELAREGNVDYVVTNDVPLRDRVLAADTPVIALRGTNKLAITRP